MEEGQDLYSNNISKDDINKIFYDVKVRKQSKQYYKKLKLLVSKRPINVKGKNELFQFKKQIIDLINDNFKDKYNLFCGSGNEIDLQLFIEYFCQLLEIKMSKMVEGYKIYDKIDKNQLLLLSKTKSTIISFLISFYDFYEDELVINNEEIVAEIINKKNTLEDSFIITLVKTVNLLNMPYITKDEFINIFKEDKNNTKVILYSKDLGILLLKIIDFFFKIKSLNNNMNNNKKKVSQKNLTNLKNNNNESSNNNVNNNNDQFSIFLDICFEKIIPYLLEFFINVILEYDIKNTITLIIEKDELSTLLNSFNNIKIFRHKLFNILCNSEKIFNKEENMYINNIVIKNNLFDKIIFYITKDINNNKYSSFKDFLFELKKVIKYYLIYNSQIEEFNNKIINIITIGITKIKNKNEKNIKMPKNNDVLLYFFKDINTIAKEEPEHKYKVYNFLIIIFQSSPFLRKYIYKILLSNFAGDLDNYQDMLGHNNFLSIFVGNLCKCDGEIIDYFFNFLHSLDKFKYFPALELNNIIYSLTCFTDAKSIQILMNNLELYNKQPNVNSKKNTDTSEINDIEKDNNDERKNLLEEMNKGFLNIFSNIINDIIKYHEDKNKIKNNENIKDKDKKDIKDKKDKINEQKTIFTAEMVLPLLDYISKIIKDNRLYQYFTDKKLDDTLNSLFNKKEHKIIAYKSIELLIKVSNNKEKNEERIKNILNRIDYILKIKDQKKNKKINIKIDEFDILKELVIILKCIITLFSYDVIPVNDSDDDNNNTNSKKDIKEKILSALSKCFNYFHFYKNDIISVFNEKYHNLIKEYLSNFYILFIKSNQNCINKKNINSPILENQHFELIINNIMSLYKLIDENQKLNEKQNFFYDITIYLINKSLNLKLIKKNNEINDKSPQNIQNDFYKYYINLFSIDEKNISDNSNFKNPYSTVYLQNPFLIITLLNSLNELNLHLDNFLKFLYLLCKINKANISYLLRHKLLLSLLKISKKDNKYNNILHDILELCFPLIQKIDLILIFEYLIKSYNNNNLNFTKEIIECLIDSFQTICFSPKEYGKGIILSGYEVKQPNIYNLINISKIAFNNYISESIIYIKQEIIFCDDLTESNKLILFRIDKNLGTNRNQYIEISLINGNLTASENVGQSNEKNDLEINAKNFINLNELNSFVFKFNNNEKILSIIINRKNIFSYPYHFSFNQNLYRSRIISETKIPKNSNQNYNSLLITIGYPLSIVKPFKDEVFHTIPYIKLLSCSIIEERNKTQNKKNMFNIYELELNNIYIEYTTKNMYSDLTTFKLDKRTKLISKYNSYESALINCIYHRYNIKTQFFKYLIFIEKYLSYSLDYNFRIEKYIFILLNNNNIEKETFKLLLELLLNYIINNNENMTFLENEELSSTFYFILLKNSKYIDEEIVEKLFTCFLSLKKLKNNFLIDLFLDYKLFDSLNQESKKKALQLIINKKLLNKKTEFIELLFKKLYILLLLCGFDEEDKKDEENKNEKNVDELIISIIIGILSQNLNNCNILKGVEELLFNLCKFHTKIKKHIQSNNKGRKKETNDIIINLFHKLYNNILIENDKDLLEKEIEEIKNLEKKYKDKFISICQSYKPSNFSENIVISFKDSINRESNNLNNSNRRLSVRNQRELNNNMINQLKSENNKLKTIEKRDFLSPFRNTFRKTSVNDTIENNISHRATENVWIDSQIKKGKIIENELVICMGNCHLCSFIRLLLNDFFTREIKFNIYENYMLNNYVETYIFNKNLDYKIQFSQYLIKEEGTSRIRNKFKIKVDKILNEEIEGNIKKGNNNINNENEKNELQNIFGFYKNNKISSNLCNFFNLGQIFNIDFVSDCIDKGDTYQCSYNCLLFKGLNYVDSVLILSEKKIYILTNMLLDSDLILYNLESPINKSFWVVDNYSDMIIDHCQYLQAYDLMYDKENCKNKNDEKDKGIKSRQIRGFQVISFSYCRINELHKKKFLHQNNAIEIFLKTGINYYLAFNKDKRDIIVSKILQNISNSINYVNDSFISNSFCNLNHLNDIINSGSQITKSDNMVFMTDTDLFVEKVHKKINNSKNNQKSIKKYKNNCKIVDIKEILEQATEKWSYGYIDTYSYIMILNTLSGRTYNDLAQYPVYPWILSNYSSNIIDLKEPDTYRDFLYPIYAQDKETRINLKDKYESFEESELKYHSGSHYSNPAFVCYYLVRVKPFSISASEIQGGRFDSPDRLFFNIKNFYKVQTKYQELVPDFFNLPEIYMNINNFNFGKTLEGVNVTDVILPPWACNSPRLFSKMNKKALESQYVSQQINNWIDLIFGYKQKGIEAEKSYNLLRDVCSNFNPHNCETEDEVELKINEICEMGINPIQLFNKPHPKRERHLIMKAFFGRSAYLTYFTPTPNKYELKNFNNNSVIKEINKYYEDSTGVLSNGEGGLSSFRICYDKNNNNDNIKDDTKNNDIYFIVGENKKLIPPSYKNFVEWGTNNSFNLVKPLHNLKYKFVINHMKGKIIEYINITRDGKYFILGYNNGVIEKYALQSIDESKINNDTNLKTFISSESDYSTQRNDSKIEGRRTILNSLFSGLSGLSIMRKTSNEKYDNTSNGNNTFTVGNNPLERNSIEVLNTISNTNTNRNNNLNKVNSINNKVNKIIFDTHITISFSNILNSDCILLNNKTKKFYQYNSVPSNIFQMNINCYDKIPGYYIHSINESEKKDLSKTKSENNLANLKKKYFIFLVNSSSRIISNIDRIDICESFSFMIVTDKMNRVYLYDFNSFNIIKYIDYSKIFNLKIKHISICPYTGDFVVATKRDVILMNINGVFLSQMSNVKNKINSCFISLIPSTQSDIYLFTGHENGDLIISKLKTNNSNSSNINSSLNNTEEKLKKEKEERIQCIRNAYINSYNSKDRNYKQYINNLPLIFDTVIKIKCSQYPLKFIKITEDLTKIISIDNNNQIIYLSYSEFFNNKSKNKDKKNLKECPMCKSSISSSKILCYLCRKKLCGKCKIEEIIPEYSFKTKKAICEDCLQLMNSTNKLLYDF